MYVCVCVCVCVCVDEEEEDRQCLPSILIYVNSGPAKLEDAADLYVKAANAYKLAKKSIGPLFLAP